jgi:hypothetical protein
MVSGTSVTFRFTDRSHVVLELERFQLGGGLRLADRRYGNTANTRSVGGYATVYAMASHRVHRFVDLRDPLYSERPSTSEPADASAHSGCSDTS